MNTINTELFCLCCLMPVLIVAVASSGALFWSGVHEPLLELVHFTGQTGIVFRRRRKPEDPPPVQHDIR